MAREIYIDEEVQVLIEHLQARGVEVDSLLMEHLLKINAMIGREDEDG